MKEYDIKITETLEKTVTVKAESRLEAETMVEDAWNREEYVLGSEDFVGADFSVQEERPLEREVIDVLLVEPGQFPRRFQVGLELEDFQTVVGGNMEVTYPFEEEVAIILNEEGKINGMPLNRAMRSEDGELYDIYAGPFMVVGLTEDDFGSLTPEQMEKYEKMFHTPETFVKMGKGLMILPMTEEMVKTKEPAKNENLRLKPSPDRGEL